MRPKLYYKHFVNRGVHKTLIDVSMALPSTSVTIVLDMSDSCTQIRELAQQIPKLLTKVPKQSSLAIYRLSCKTALNTVGNDSLGHLIDGSINLLKWLEDRRLVQQAQYNGTLIGCVIDAIRSDIRASYDKSIVIVLTDGQLLDRTEAVLPAKTLLIGICCEASSEAVMNWKRVLPSSELLPLSHPKLTPELFSHSDTSDVIELSFPEEILSKTELYDIKSGTLTEFDRKVQWSPSNGMLTVLLSAPHPLPEDFAIELSRGSAPGQEQLLIRDGFQVEDDRFAHIEMKLVESTQGTANCIFDSSTSSHNPDDMERMVAEIEQLADSRAAWTSTTACQCLIAEQKDYNDLTIDAALCLVQRNDNGISRLVVIALNKARTPALFWPTGSDTPCGKAGQSLRIAFDKMERRWQATIDEVAPSFLDPRSSQRFSSRLRFDGQDWSCIYSGPFSV